MYGLPAMATSCQNQRRILERPPSTVQISEGLGNMVYLAARTLKDRSFATVAVYVSLLATLCLAGAEASKPGKSDGGQKKVALVIHAKDHRGNPVAPSSVKDIRVTEHGKKLQVVGDPNNAGPKQIALLLDSNFHQRKVLALEQQTAVELVSEFEREKAQALVMSYGAEIHSSGELTDDFRGLKNFTSSLRVETDKRNETVLLYDTMKRAIEKLSDGPGTKAVVIFAEGNDHGSSIGWKSLTGLANRSHIACYVVLFADHSFYGREVRHYGYYLVELASKTGGGLWEVGDNPRKAHETAHQVIALLNSQGLIEVIVQDVHRNRFHPIRVTSPSYRVSAQTGYFDNEIQ